MSNNTKRSGIQNINLDSSSAANRSQGPSAEQWNRLQRQLKQYWGQVSEQALLETQGDFAKLIALLQRHSNESRQMIDQPLCQLSDHKPEAVGNIGSGRLADSALAALRHRPARGVKPESRYKEQPS